MEDSVITLLLGTIIGAVFENLLNYRSSSKLYKKQQLNEIKNIAKAMDISLAEYCKPDFCKIVEEYKTERLDRLKDPTIRTFFLPMFPLYSSDDPYFVFKHDISKFEHNLSADIYQFYNDLIRAEAIRVFIVEKIPLIEKFCRKNPEANGDGIPSLKFAHEEMKSRLISCSDNISYIRSRLKEIYED